MLLAVPTLLELLALLSISPLLEHPELRWRINEGCFDCFVWKEWPGAWSATKTRLPREKVKKGVLILLRFVSSSLSEDCETRKVVVVV
jgi:hypothetical protein